jgi:hypothetical protein
MSLIPTEFTGSDGLPNITTLTTPQWLDTGNNAWQLVSGPLPASKLDLRR